MKSQRLTTAVGSLAGAVLIHAVMVACSGSKGVSGENAVMADAPTATTCAQWQVKTIVPPGLSWTTVTYSAGGQQYTELSPVVTAANVDPGWEPIGVASDLSVTLLERKCTQMQ